MVIAAQGRIIEVQGGDWTMSSLASMAEAVAALLKQR
jgi:hypothetical protein